MSGCIVAGTLVAYLSDKYGRRPLVIYCFIIEIVASISCALSPTIIQYLISRFLVGIATPGRAVAFWTLCKKSSFVILSKSNMNYSPRMLGT